MIEIVDASPETFDDELKGTPERLIVAYFWGPDCPNCEVFAERLPHLLDELGAIPVTLLKVNAYEHPDLARRYGIYGIPHFLLFRRGRLLGKMSQFRGDAFWLGVVREKATEQDRPSDE